MRRTGLRFKGMANQKGITLILVTILLVVFLGVAALAIDVGYMMVVKNELQNIADASALAGARTLGRLYQCNGDIANCPEPMPYEAQQVYEPPRATITNVINEVADQNRAGGKSHILINDADIVIGDWDGNTKTLTANPVSPKAVRVTARRDDSNANGPITMFFARVMGINTVNMSATATAALTGECTVPPGGLPIPIGISSYFFTHPGYCHDNITFYPSNSPDSCAGWNIYNRPEYHNANDQALRTTIQQLDTGAYESPELGTGTIFKFTGGTMSQQTFDAMKLLFDHNKDATGKWQVVVAVYQADSCANPHGEIPIVGFATVIITAVTGSPTNTIVGTVECNYVDTTGHGGCANFGNLAPIPGLVQ